MKKLIFIVTFVMWCFFPATAHSAVGVVSTSQSSCYVQYDELPGHSSWALRGECEKQARRLIRYFYFHHIPFTKTEFNLSYTHLWVFQTHL